MQSAMNHSSCSILYQEQILPHCSIFGYRLSSGTFAPKTEEKRVQCYHQHMLCKHYGEGLGTIKDVVDASMKSFWKNHPDGAIVASGKEVPLNKTLVTDQAIEADKQIKSSEKAINVGSESTQEGASLSLDGLLSIDQAELEEIDVCL